MTFLAAVRRGRRDDAELGKGVWRRAHDRFRRGLDRYHQILEGIQDEELRSVGVPIANELADLLPRVRAVCAAAHATAPSEGMDIPASREGYLSEAHRALSRAGNALAATAEALAMAKLAPPLVQGTDEGPAAGLAVDQVAPHRVETSSAASVGRRAEVVVDAVAAAERILGDGGPPSG